jgi:hypothetical protein
MGTLAPRRASNTIVRRPAFIAIVVLLVAGCAADDVGERSSAAGGELRVTSVRQLSADGTRLELGVELGCPARTVERVDVAEATGEVAVTAVDGGASGDDEDCSQEIGRLPAAVPIELAAPVGERAVVAGHDRQPVPWSHPRGTLGVVVTVAGAAGFADGVADDGVGLTFDHEGTCVLVWPGQFDGGQQSFLGRVVARPGGIVRIGSAPMQNPRPTVVERCPDDAGRDVVDLVLPVVPVPSAAIDALRLDLEQGFVTTGIESWLIDPARVQVTWLGG